MKFQIRLFVALSMLISSSNLWASGTLTPVSLHTLSSEATTINAEIASGTLSLSARARWYTPMFYLEDFPRYFGWGSGATLILDDWAQIDPTETVLLPKSVLSVRKILPKDGQLLLEVTSKEYPYDTDPHYIDARFVQVYQISSPLKERIIKLPTRWEMLRRLKAQVGEAYVWWGNAPDGVPYLAEIYPSSHTLDTVIQKKWILDGWDCSGILYGATNGYTPRNTSKLISFWSGLEIAGKTKDEILPLLKPLDLIVWKWHNLIVIDKKHIIESVANFSGSGNYSTPNGVRIRTTEDALTEIFEVKNRIGVNNYEDSIPEWKKKFVIRRWY